MASRSWSAALRSRRYRKPIFRLISSPRRGRGYPRQVHRGLDQRRAQGRVQRREVHRRRHQKPDPALRPAQVRLLPPRRRAVLARLSVHLRVLRHHRVVRPRAAHQDRRRRCWPSSIGSIELGYRGHVDFVDDNLIGNKKAVKAFLPHLTRWLEEHDYPFEFTTEASLNLADDDELLQADERGELLRRVHRDRKPGSRDAGADAQEAEHAPQHRRERPPHLRGTACS